MTDGNPSQMISDLGASRREFVEDDTRHAYDVCAFCRHWQPGAVVVQGETIGWCELWTATVPAGFGCRNLAKRTMPVMALGQ